MNYKIGIIGVGNMGQAMISGIIKSKIISRDKIFASSLITDEFNRFIDETGVCLLNSNRETVKECDIIILAVKPDRVADVLSECADIVDNKKIIITIAAGIPISVYEKILGYDKKIVRTMPNTPAMVLESMTAVCANKNVADEDRLLVKELFEAFGTVEFMQESLMNVATAISGSSPAYAFIFIEAMADAAVRMGMPRAAAYKMSAQALKGAAQMVLETNIHPAQLKDNVCSPKGTTIEAVVALERNGFRNAVIEAVCDCAVKAGRNN